MRFLLHTIDGKSIVSPDVRCDNKRSVPISKLRSFDTPPFNPTFSYSRELQQLLQNKECLIDELPFSIEAIHTHYLHGTITYLPGVVQKGGEYKCMRCGNRVQRHFARFSCSRCKDTCVYCRKCIVMGKVSTCSPLLRWQGPKKTVARQKSPVLSWQGELSDGQKKASRAVEKMVGQHKELLVWAVCGAGKTEILFHGIAKALRQGQRVCVSSPRVDVILELLPRFKQVFPRVTLAAFYSGSREKNHQAQLILSTTHQLLRFQNSFDFVVIDEVDAFPLDVDESLAFAVKKAKKPSAATVYLSATPSPFLQRRVREGSLSVVKIPLRYHGYPLPVPRFYWVGNWRKQMKNQKLPDRVKQWTVMQCDKNQQAFLFVSSISIVKQITPMLQDLDSHIEGTYAEDEERREKIRRFRNGKTRIIVTTTILERGITVPGANVAVFGADDSVFSERALIQMSGRVGRSKDSPDGDVLFFHHGKTKAMVKARCDIEAMNRLAFHR